MLRRHTARNNRASLAGKRGTKVLPPATEDFAEWFVREQFPRSNAKMRREMASTMGPQAICERIDIDVLLRVAVRQLRFVVGADVVTIHVWNRRLGRLRPRFSSDAGRWRRVDPERDADPVVAECFERRVLMNVGNVRIWGNLHDRPLPGLDVNGGYVTRSTLCVPLTLPHQAHAQGDAERHRCLGVLHLTNRLNRRAWMGKGPYQRGTVFSDLDMAQRTRAFSHRDECSAYVLAASVSFLLFYEREVLRGIPPLVLGYPKNSSKISTAVKSNSFPTILGPFVLAPQGLDDWREIPQKNFP